MSSIFSDPWFRRGSTLLSGELIETDDGLVTGVPVAGNEIVGQVKAFQDVNPIGAGERYSNRLVYCVAARYKGNNCTGADLKRQLVDFVLTKPLTDFGVSGSAASAARASKTDVAAGTAYGVVDEYLSDTLAIRTNDIVWVVVKGPTTVVKETGTVIAAGAGVFVSNTAGAVSVTGASVGTVLVGDQIAGAEIASGTLTARINLWSNRI
jgi:hypothetical protein